MISRWDSKAEDINLLKKEAKRFARRVLPNIKKGRGRPPKHAIEDYLSLIVIKEDEKKSLRKAEKRLSKQICKERVDHSVIAYWEKKIETSDYLRLVIRAVGIRLEKLLSYQFSVVDATDMTSWHGELTTFHLINRICDETVYPIGISFLTGSVKAPVDQAVPDGKGKAYLDAGYDDNKTIMVMFGKNYEPIVCPNKGRWKGYWRKKARKLYKDPENRLGYRQRGRGESFFGSLTNAFGDRLTARCKPTMIVRLTARVIALQLKLLIRASIVFVVII